MDMSSLRREAGGANAAARAQMQSQGRVRQVKNRSAAARQITAEQLLREAQEFKEDLVVAPRQQLVHPDELKEYQGRKRKEFEDGLRRNRHNNALWMRYAAWEAKMDDLARARSVFERALDVDYRNASIWLKYAEMEMRHRQVNHARNVWDRAVALLPRIDQLWYKYAYMEEMLGEQDKARIVFDRWMAFHPNEQAWLSFIKFEIRHNNIERARALYERFTLDHLTLDAYLKYAKFETRYGSVALARSVYERIQQELTEEERSHESYFVAFAHFEERNKEYERARVIYQYALDHLPKARARDLYEKYVAFEKAYGDKEGIELVILSAKRFQYEEEIAQAKAAAASPTSPAEPNYDLWFDYLRLEQDRLEAIQASANAAVNTAQNIASQCARVRDLFERAVAQLPPQLDEKKAWKRYIYLWIYWLVFEEQTMADARRCREIGDKLVGARPDALIPHAKFTFAKLWLHLAHFELRQGDLDAARRKLGEALGRTSHLPHTKLKLFAGYLALELQLGAVDRVRTLYEKLCEYQPSLASSWCDFAAFEARLSEPARARALYELAVSQAQLDQPERVWKAYIDFETAEKNIDAVRQLYARLLARTQHVKVWLSAAAFETSQKALPEARTVFTRAEEYFKTRQAQVTEAERGSASSLLAGGANATPPSAALLALKEERLALLQAWRDFERAHGTPAEVAAVQAKLPQQLKKRRAILADGSVVAPSAAEQEGGLAIAGFEEYYDYVFPEEAAKSSASGLQLMERAKMWKRQQEMKQQAEQARLLEEEERRRREQEQQATMPPADDGGEEKQQQQADDAAMHDDTDDAQPGAAADMEQ